MELNDPVWIVYVVIAILTIVSGVLLSGRGSWLVAGYNTATAAEKKKYDEKKLCRVTGACLAICDLMVIIMLIFEKLLPEWFPYVMIGVILADVAVTLVLAETICRNPM